jgi:hypothetical protein
MTEEQKDLMKGFEMMEWKKSNKERGSRIVWQYRLTYEEAWQSVKNLQKYIEQMREKND